jgi:hypothetical protein
MTIQRCSFHSLLAVIGLLFACATASAATTTGPADVYEVQITKIELYNNITASWTTAFDGLSEAVDIAAGTSGQAAGDFLSGLTVPDGVYTKAKITPGTSILIEGSFPGGFHTTTATVPAGGRTVSMASTAGSADECTVTILASDATTVGSTVIDFSATPITVMDGTADKKIRVVFDVSNALSFNDDAPGSEFIYPNLPVVSGSIN